MAEQKTRGNSNNTDTTPVKSTRKPTKYNAEKAEYILQQLSTTTKGVSNICKEMGMSQQTVYDWINNNDEGFREKYARAREMQADVWEEEILQIADDSSRDDEYDENGNRRENREWVNRSRLRVEARKWLMSKRAPKKYGDRVGIDMDVKLAAAIQIAAPDQYLGGGSSGQTGIDVAQQDESGDIVRDVRFLRADQVRELLRAGKDVSDAEVVDEDDNG